MSADRIVDTARRMLAAGESAEAIADYLRRCHEAAS